MTISKQRLNEIVVEIVESGFGAKQNDWASHIDFALDLIRRVEAELPKATPPGFYRGGSMYVILPLVSEE